MAKRNYHVVQRGGGWGVLGEGKSRSASNHTTQQQAFEAARELAQKTGGEVFVHGRNGQIRERNTYGSDPYPPEG